MVRRKEERRERERGERKYMYVFIPSSWTLLSR
jgi:hypothetical protein